MRNILLVLTTLMLLSFTKTKPHGDLINYARMAMNMPSSQLISLLSHGEGLNLELWGEPIFYNDSMARVQLDSFFTFFPPQKADLTEQGVYNNGTRYFSGYYQVNDSTSFRLYVEANLDIESGEHNLSHITVDSYLPEKCTNQPAQGCDH
jgi:hypothetical protein